jgi:hypothetical protein
MIEDHKKPHKVFDSLQKSYSSQSNGNRPTHAPPAELRFWAELPSVNSASSLFVSVNSGPQSRPSTQLAAGSACRRAASRTTGALRMVADRRGLGGDTLVRISRLTAKVDNNCIADGFRIYLHSFIVAANGEWAVVQQGMNTTSGFARRYH